MIPSAAATFTRVTQRTVTFGFEIRNLAPFSMSMA